MDELNKDLPMEPEEALSASQEEIVPTDTEPPEQNPSEVSPEESEVEGNPALDFPLADAPEADQEMPELLPEEGLEIPETEEVPLEMPVIPWAGSEQEEAGDEAAEEASVEEEAAEEEILPEESAEEDIPAEEETPAEEEPAVVCEEAEETQQIPAEPVLENPLSQPELIESIGPDEEAVAEVGLVNPEDLEMEEILEILSPEEPQSQEPQHQETEQAEVAAPEAEAEAGDAEEPQAPEQTPASEEAAPQTEEEPPAQEPAQEEQDEEEDEEPEEEPKKRRPKNDKAYGLFGIPHIVVTAIWLGIVLFVGIGLGKFVWNCAADVLALGREDSLAVITIAKDDDLDTIAEKLKITGLIKYPSLFKIYAEISDAMDSIKPGTYNLNTNLDYNALVDYMSSNLRRETTNVTIPEGYNCAQIFKLLERRGVCTAADLEAAAANANLGDYWFLEDVDRGSVYCLEGFLFPDTYTFYLGHDPVGVLQKFLNNFNKRFNDSMRIKLDTLNMNLSEKMRQNGLSEEYIAEHQMTVRDVVIIASMIEKETSSNLESYNISSVIYNRLTNPDKFPYLQIDATLVYYTGHSELTMEDLITDHPYNTYTRTGLIPGAISNPGSFSLDAALNPTETAYYFYALDPSVGSHHFSETLQEHNDFLASLKKDDQEP